jgi:hypothetical protein
MRSSPNPNRVVWYELVAFGILLATIWVASLLELTEGTDAPFQWADPLLETGVLLVVALPTLYLTRRLVKRLHYLEGFLRLCAWCHKVEVNGQWLSIEEFLNLRLSTRTSHGICESCNRVILEEIRERKHQDGAML